MIEFIFILLSVLVAIPVFVLFAQVVMALIGPGAIADEAPAGRVKVMVIVPAHNEELVISETITALQSQLGDEDHLLIIADNCSDNTASLARSLDAEVLERTDDEKRGKGYALDFGIRHLKNSGNTHEILVVIDADCIVEENCLVKLVDKCSRSGRPVQALYLMQSQSNNFGRKIAEFAWIVKNQVRSLGYFNMGLPCQLMGTGMAFPFALIVEADVANANIVEDMKLGIDMALKGHSPLFCPDAIVVSGFPSEEKGIRSQRTRWEHGHLNTILTEGPGLLTAAVRKRDPGLLAMALDLMVPPLALLAILLSAAFALTSVANYLAIIGIIPLLIVVVACFLFALSVLLARYGFARHVLSIKDLVDVPVYVIRKIPMYFQFWTRRQKEWIRTDRD